MHQQAHLSAIKSIPFVGCDRAKLFWKNYLYYRHIKTIAILHIRYCNSFTTGTQFQDFHCNNVSTTGVNKIQQSVLFGLASEDSGCWRHAGDWQGLCRTARLCHSRWRSGLGLVLKAHSPSALWFFRFTSVMILQESSKPFCFTSKVVRWTVRCLHYPLAVVNAVSHGGTSSESLWSSSVVPSCHGGQRTVLHALWL